MRDFVEPYAKICIPQGLLGLSNQLKPDVPPTLSAARKAFSCNQGYLMADAVLGMKHAVNPAGSNLLSSVKIPGV